MQTVLETIGDISSHAGFQSLGHESLSDGNSLTINHSNKKSESRNQ
jgi:hypothetical protein